MTLEKSTHGRLRAEVRVDGDLAARASSTFASERHFREGAKELGVPADWLKACVDRFGKGEPGPFDVPAAEGDTFTVTLRGRLAPAAQAHAYSDPDPAKAFGDAVECAQACVVEPILSWEDDERLCVVDADYHGVAHADRPGPEGADRLLLALEPRPFAYWSTHGRGLRLCYAAGGGLTARELAAAGALSLRLQDSRCQVELKCDTRHPGYPRGDEHAGPVRWQNPSFEAPALAWGPRREVDDDAVVQWLCERGLVRGHRYPHSSCPVEPGEGGGRDPVVVRDGGVFCHACAGRGVRRGSRVDGWFPFAALVGGVALPGPLLAAVGACTHWEHARFLVGECLGGVPEAVARAAYSAALVLRGHPRGLVRRAFTAGRNLIRLDRRWATAAGETYTKDLAPILSKLPAAQRLGDNGCHVPCPERVARLDQPVDLTAEGYPALTPVWGVRVYSHFLDLPGRNPVVFPTRELASPSLESFRPRYVAPHRRPPEADAWATLEGPLPGLNRQAIRLLVAAKGCAEGEVGLPPMIFFSGPTASSKTASVTIAAAVCGDGARSVNWSRNVERVRQGLLEAKQSGSFAVFNEAIKQGTQDGDPRGCLDFMLNLTPDSLSHQMYVGPAVMGALPVLVWTDTSLPSEIKTDAQLARRLVHVHMPRQVDWVPTLREHGIGQLATLRSASREIADAMDVILSGVVDEFFRAPTTFDEVARALGFGTLADVETEARQEVDDSLRALFRAACVAPDAEGADAARWSGRGWKVISRHLETDLANLWREVADVGWTTSRRCEEVDWAKVLSTAEPVAFESRAHGQAKVAIRWVRRQSKRSYQVNGELLEVAT